MAKSDYGSGPGGDMSDLEKKESPPDDATLDVPLGDHLYPIQELKARCPECGGDADFRNQFVLKRSVYGDKKPSLRMKMDGLGSGFHMETTMPILPRTFYFATRLSCVDCGYFNQQSGETQEQVEAMIERRQGLLFPKKEPR
jgi:hypothetical protein